MRLLPPIVSRYILFEWPIDVGVTALLVALPFIGACSMSESPSVLLLTDELEHEDEEEPTVMDMLSFHESRFIRDGARKTFPTRLASQKCIHGDGGLLKTCTNRN